MKLWPWLTLAVAVIITRMSKETDASKPAAPAPGNVIVTPSSLPGVDVFPAGSQLKTFALYGIIGVLALLLLKK